MPEQDRIDIVSELRCVDQAILSVDHDRTVTDSLRLIRTQHPEAELLFCNGGDRSATGDPVPSTEAQLADELGLRIVYGVGDQDKADSSSRINQELSRDDTPAG